MDPTRKAEIRGHQIHEHYWAGRWPVYVDNRLCDGDFEHVCAVISDGHAPPFKP